MVEGYKDDQMIRRLIKMSEGWYCITKQDGNIFFNDLRFGLMNEDEQNPEFVFRYLLKFDDGKVTAHEAESPSRKEPEKLLKRLWVRTLGN
jgi:inner membrane protein